MSVEIIKQRGYTFIFDDNQRVSLTGLWKQMGALPRKRPALWLKSDVAQEFMANVKEEATARRANVQTMPQDESAFAYWKVALLYCAFLSPKMKTALMKVLRRRFALEDEIGADMTYYMEEIEASSSS